MKKIFAGFELLFSVACLVGCGGGGGGPLLSQQNQSAHSAFTFLDATLPQNATNVPITGLSITLTFSNPINSTQANLDLNASTSETVIMLTGDIERGNVPISISVSGPTLKVTPIDPLLYGDQYTLTIRSALLDIYGQSLQLPTNGDLPLTFNTQPSSASGSGSSPGMVTLGFALYNTYPSVSISQITYSLGTQSQLDGSGVVSPSANFNIENNVTVNATQTTPAIPSGVFSSQQFTYNIFYSFQSGTTYYAAVKACMTQPNGTALCSPYSTEAMISL